MIEIYQKVGSRFITIGGMRVNIIQIPEVVKIMEGWIENKNFGKVYKRPY